MLETLISLVNLLQSSLNCVLYGSYKIGYYLVNCIAALVQLASSVLSTGGVIIKELYESVNIFLQDNFQFLQLVLHFVLSSYDSAYRGLALVANELIYSVNSFLLLIVLLYDAIINGLAMILFCITQTFVLIKTSVILFGSGVWFLITLLPLFFYYTCVTIVRVISECIKELLDITYFIKRNARTVITFFFDVPLESAIGLIIAASLTYISAQFYVSIRSYVKRKFRILRNWFFRHQRSLRINSTQLRIALRNELYNRARSSVQHQEERPNTRLSKKSKSPGDEERYCIICQERPKCVLLLPCKHVCLCVECNHELGYYDETCPICRRVIENTMKIYI